MMKIFDVHYIGRSKERRPGEFSALGWVEGQWRLIFPETVLRRYFKDEDPTIEKTLYGVLGASETATKDEIKSAYRRMALQWHPDQCREPNAKEIFIRIKEAYDLLSDPHKRQKYDAGLVLEKSIGFRSALTSASNHDNYGYRSPLRCGSILCTGEEQKKWFVASEILQWLDITNSAGKTLVASWVYGEDAPREAWV